MLIFLRFVTLFFICWSSSSCVSRANEEVDTKPDWFNFATSRLKSILRENGISDFSKATPHVLPPNYMIDLYHKETKERFLPVLQEGTSIVRCIMGKIRRETLNFNLSSVSSNENISRAEVRIFRKKSRHGKLPRIKFFLSHPRPRSSSPRKYLPTPSQLPSTPGWQTVDVTNLLKSSLKKWGSIGFSVESLIPEFGTKNEAYHSLPLDELIRITYKPFLVIFSSSKKSMEEFPFTELLDTPSWNAGEESNRIPGLNDYYNSEINQKRNLGENNELENGVNSILAFGDTPLHLDSPLPNNNDDGRIFVNDQFDGEDEEQPPHSLRRRSLGGHNGFSSNDFLSYLSAIETQSNGSYPYVKSQKLDNKVLVNQNYSWTHQKKSRKGRRRYSKQKSRNRSFNEKLGKPVESKTKTHSYSGECGVQEFSIPLDFDWAERIIAPASFPLNYCTGTCSYFKENNEEVINPRVLTGSLWPTETSGTCCTPSKTAHLSLLFVDKFDTIVLKSYPNATIVGCSCRS